MKSIHYKHDRQAREQVIRDVIGYGNIIKSIEVDKGHINGPEIHKLSDTGIITIYNKKSGKMITKLVARCGQAKRFGRINKELLDKCYYNTVVMHYNEI